MILENLSLIDDRPGMPVLPESTRLVALLRMEAQDALRALLEVLHQQDLPVLLLLPASSTTLSHPDHFLALRSLLSEGAHPPFLCLVIPAHRSREATFAAHYGIAHVSSLEEGLHSLARFSQQTDRLASASSPGSNRRPGLPPHPLSQASGPSPAHPLSLPSTRGKLPVLPVAGGLVVLLLLSLALLPLLLMPTRSAAATPASTAAPVGTLTFLSSGQFDPSTTHGYNDVITLSLPSLTAPPTAMGYGVWLMPDPHDDTTPPLLLGTLPSGRPLHLLYASSDHTNLLASYSGVRITLQASENIPDTPSQNPADWKFQGFLPNIATPGDENHYSLLSHLRHLLAQDPTLQANQIPGGLVIWLTRNLSKVEEWASAAQGDWHGPQTSAGQAAQIHSHMLRILEYLDGASYYARDVPAGSPWLVDPQAGTFGLLNRVPNQNPPGYLAHVDIHLTGLAGSPGHTAQQQQLAILIDTVIRQMRTDLLHVRTDASRLVQMNTQQLQQPGNEATLDEMATLTTAVKAGWLDPKTGENIGGVLWISSRLQQLATIPLTPV